jgi:hypothetical protein
MTCEPILQRPNILRSPEHQFFLVSLGTNVFYPRESKQEVSKKSINVLSDASSPLVYRSKLGAKHLPKLSETKQ